MEKTGANDSEYRSLGLKNTGSGAQRQAAPTNQGHNAVNAAFLAFHKRHYQGDQPVETSHEVPSTRTMQAASEAERTPPVAKAPQAGRTNATEGDIHSASRQANGTRDSRRRGMMTLPQQDGPSVHVQGRRGGPLSHHDREIEDTDRRGNVRQGGHYGRGFGRESDSFVHGSHHMRRGGRGGRGAPASTLYDRPRHRDEDAQGQSHGQDGFASRRGGHRHDRAESSEGGSRHGRSGRGGRGRPGVAPDADFYRGETPVHKQLYQPTTGIRSNVRSTSVTGNEGRDVKASEIVPDDEEAYLQQDVADSESVGEGAGHGQSDEEIEVQLNSRNTSSVLKATTEERAAEESLDTESEGEDTKLAHNDIEKVVQQEPATRPGIIKTGIDLATVVSSKKGRKGSEGKDKNRRREGKDKKHARNGSHGSDGQATEGDEDYLVDYSRGEGLGVAQVPDNHSRYHPYHLGPPPPPPGGFEGFPPPPPPPHGYHDYAHGPPPYGPPPPWAGHHEGFPPFGHHHRPPPPFGHHHHRHPPPFGHHHHHHHHHRHPPPFDGPPPHFRGHPERHDYRIPRGRAQDESDHGLQRARRQERDVRFDRDERSRDGHDRQSIGFGSGSPKPIARQLFDPRKDDPMRFMIQKGWKEGSMASDARSVISSATTQSSLSSLSIASSDYHSRSNNQKDALLDEVESTLSGAGSNALLRELKAAYRELLDYETKLQDEDSLSRAGRQEHSSTTGTEERTDEYWCNLVHLHREAAEAFHSFMERCTDPMIPTSIHSISQKYNLPSRLWKTVFQLLFERFRAALAVKPTEPEPTPSLKLSASVASDPPNNALEHLIDFSYFAYTFYTQVLEQQSLTTFRATWIEQLGDIALYRMEAAKLAGGLTSSNSLMSPVSPSTGTSLKDLLDQVDGQETLIHVGNGADKQQAMKKQLVSRKDRKKGFPGMAKLGDELEVADPPGNSIGIAALDDWDLVEVEIWKTVARDWYFLGLTETPGTGRLHYHLASISEGDELRTLFHLTKCVTASHPYSAGQDAMLSFFSPEKQAARIEGDAPAVSLLIHLHGIMYTCTDLDKFDETLQRLEDKLSETFKNMKASSTRTPRRSARGRERDEPSLRLNRDATWIMMAVVNLGAVMEYGKESGTLKVALSKAKEQKRTEKQTSKAEKRSTSHARSDPTPAEASLNDLASRIERLAVEASNVGHEDGIGREQNPGVTVIPTTLRLALRLTFSLLLMVIKHPFKPNEPDPAICPYITIILTFLSTLAHNPAALYILQTEVPWQPLLGFLDSLPKYAVNAYLRKDSNIPSRLLGITLPEDWCIRGLEWTGKQLFGRGYWKGKLGTAFISASSQTEGSAAPLNGTGIAGGALGGNGESQSYSMPESEMDVLSERYEGPAMPAHAGGPTRSMRTVTVGVAGKDEDKDVQHMLDEDRDSSSDRETVARLRWKRVALCAAWLAKAVPFINIDMESGKVTLDEEMLQVIKERTASSVDASTSLSFGNDPATIGGSIVDNDEDDFLFSGDEDETVKELKARRRELKALLRESRESRNDQKQHQSQQQSTSVVSSNNTGGYRSRDGRGTSTIPTLNALAGYTTLVFDTNILLEALETFACLLTSKKWSLVIPLAVVTELDGISSSQKEKDDKDNDISHTAHQAIKFLEVNIKSYSTNLKVQTSKGNYLRDLNIRREDIDFGHHQSTGGVAGAGTGKNDGSIKSMDDVILNVAVWQKTHWLDRRALLGISTTTTGGKDKTSSPSEMIGINSSSPNAPAAAKTILVSNDRTLRLKGRARGLEVCDATALLQLVEQQQQQESPNG